MPAEEAADDDNLTHDQVIDDLFEDEHYREELGLNTFTAPSIERVLRDLRDLRPIPFEKATRPWPAHTPTDRRILALRFGFLIAQGFLVLDAERKGDIENVAREMLDYARGLSVRDRIVPRAKHMLELAMTGDWKRLRGELAAAQVDSEKAMLALRDEEIAHFIGLGGWLRGLEIASVALLENYTAERAAGLARIDLADYFLDRLDTLHPSLKRTPLIILLVSELQSVRLTLTKPPGQSLYPSDVAEVRRRVATICDAILDQNAEEMIRYDVD